jgi:flagellar assembly protein FliH
MSRVIPKEQLTAYQRWESAAFDDEISDGFEPMSLGASPTRGAENDASPEPESEPQVVLPTAEELERLHQEAWQEGYQLGLKEGRNEGHIEGYQAGKTQGEAEGERYVKDLQSLAIALEAGRLQQDKEVAREVLELSLVMARQILRSAIQVKPELILNAISEALKTLPTLNGHHKIVTHPDSAKVVRDWLAHEHGHLSWKVMEDAQMEPGDFRFESAYSDLDGSIKSRWLELTSCLGADDSWIT